MGWVFAPSTGLAQFDSLVQRKIQSVQTDVQSVQTTGLTLPMFDESVQTDIQSVQTDVQSVQMTGLTLPMFDESVQTDVQSVQINSTGSNGNDELTRVEPLQTVSFADLSRIKSIRDGQNLQSLELWSALSTITEIESQDMLNQSGSPRLYTDSRSPRWINENNTPRDPNRIYRKRFFWGIAFSGTQAKMKMQLDPVFWQRNDSLINIRPQGQLGGGFGGSVAMRIMRQWELKMLTMLQLHNRNIDFDWKYTPTQTLKIETISLDIPLTLKYRSDMPNNTGFFVVGGVRWSHDFQSMEGTVIGASKPLVAIKEDTYYYEFGCGFEFRMEYVDMSIELKMSNGLNNALVRVPESYYSGSMSAIFPRLFSITLMAQN